jgi:GTP-binding protein HflX
MINSEITQRLQEVNPKTYIGSGKVQEAMQLMDEQKACTIIFDAELTPGQQKALENAFNKKVIQDDFLAAEGEIKVLDRTALILDIFAQHAKTREGWYFIYPLLFVSLTLLSCSSRSFQSHRQAAS